MTELRIPFNTTKILMRIPMALLMLAVGIWFAFGNTSILKHVPKLDDPDLRKFLGWVTMVVAFAMILFLMKCLFGSKSALIIDPVGIEDNSQLLSKGIIYWTDISSIEKTRVGFSLFTMPAIKINYKDATQKPSFLSSALLPLRDVELQNIIQEYLEKNTTTGDLIQ